MPLVDRVKRRGRLLVGPRGRDVFVVVTCGVSVLLQAWLTAVTQHRYFWATVALVAGTVATVAMWWRRRYPVAVTLIAGLAGVLPSVMLPLAYAVATLAVRRRDRVLTGLTVMAALCFSAPLDWDSAWSVNRLIPGAFAAAAFALFGAYVGARRDLLASLRDRAERAEHERELRADQARLSERGRIAREMHDVLAHKVSLIALHAGALELSPDRPPAEVETTAGLIRETARATLEDLRGVLGVLRSTDPADAQPLTPQPTLADLDRLVAESRAAGVSVDLRVDPWPELPDVLSRTAYRVVQEALTNVHKHARGARTEVIVSHQPGRLVVAVRNARPVGAGSLLPGAGAGLPGLTERVTLAGGGMEAGPTEQGGWALTAWLPSTASGGSSPGIAPAPLADRVTTDAQ